MSIILCYLHTECERPQQAHRLPLNIGLIRTLNGQSYWLDVLIVSISLFVMRTCGIMGEKRRQYW